MPPKDTSHENNFDLLRLYAALEVMVGHTMLLMHAGISQPLLAGIVELTRFFPGVPIFFIISGFLISKSFASRPDDLPRFVRNRALRLYPALWVAFAVSLLCILTLGGIALHNFASLKFVAWFVEQCFCPTGYTPAFLRNYGVGTPNGSLWSIPVEIQFYVSVPILYALGRRFRHWNLDALIVSMTVLSFCLYCWQITHFTFLAKSLQLTFAPRIWMFFIGMLIFRHWDRLRPLLEGKSVWWIALYLLPQCLLIERWNSTPLSSAWVVFLGFAVISAAYSAKPLSQRLLSGTDISYGIYLYHVVIINVLVQKGYMGPGWPVFAVYVSTVVVATLSWFFVEKPSLKRKQASINPVGQQSESGSERTSGSAEGLSVDGAPASPLSLS